MASEAFGDMAVASNVDQVLSAGGFRHRAWLGTVACLVSSEVVGME